MQNDYFIKNIYSKFLDISGEDSSEFLQGLITNDINKCKDDKPIYACLLTPQGKFSSDFFIIKYLNHYIIEIHEKYFDSFYSKLKIYKLRSKVEFKENTDLLSLIIFSKHNPLFGKNTIFFDDPRNNNLGVKAYIDKKSNDLIYINKF